MPKMTGPVLAMAGNLMFGASWQREMAVALQVAEITIQRWEAGVPIPQGVGRDVAVLLAGRARMMLALARELEEGEET